ncbi:MAG: oxygenase MpaB family protein [Ilumatobacteraceae bacterium]
MTPTAPLAQLRTRVGEAVFSAVAGRQGPDDRARIVDTPGPRWFDEGSPITIVHGDSSMFVGGLRALLLQSLHPLAMAGVAEHSDYRHDPWGRLARTSYFLAATTFGSASIAEQAVATVRAVHERVQGVAGDGRPYAASDPHLLRWVHVAEVDSFLRAHRRFGREPLTAEGYDHYVEQMARIGSALGAEELPTTCAELDAAIQRYRPELRSTPEARRAARFLILQPPMPAVARARTLRLQQRRRRCSRGGRWPLRLPWLRSRRPPRSRRWATRSRARSAGRRPRRRLSRRPMRRRPLRRRTSRGRLLAADLRNGSVPCRRDSRPHA